MSFNDVKIEYLKNIRTPEDFKAISKKELDKVAEEIRSAGPDKILREYRFTLLINAAEYAPDTEGEDVILLQGVVDCCYETEEGLTVVDFKTDRVNSEEEVAQRAEIYRSQLNAYSLALERVLEKKVSRRVLYFLRKGQTVEV